MKLFSPAETSAQTSISPKISGAIERRASVLERGSPLPLFYHSIGDAERQRTAAAENLVELPVADFKSKFSSSGRALRRCRAFSLLEVMIAAGIFFLAVFAILGLVSATLGNARRLQRPQVDASPVLARFAATNILVEGTYSGDLSDFLGDAYRDYRWTADITEVETNKLFNVRCIVQPSYGREVISDLSTLLFRPDSPPGSMDGGNFTGGLR